MSSRSLRAAGAAAITLLLLSTASPGRAGSPAAQDKETVGPKPGGRTVVPVNQVVTPYGLTTTLPGLRPQALALSPDGRLLAVSGKTPELVILNPVTRQGRTAGRSPGRSPGGAASRGRFADDPRSRHRRPAELHRPHLFARRPPHLHEQRRRQRQGLLGRFATEPSSRRTRSPCPSPARRGGPRRSRPAWPSRPTAASSSSAATFPTACSMIDTQAPSVVRAFDVGVAPFDVVLAAGKAYVSNWGGRRPQPGRSRRTGRPGYGGQGRYGPAYRQRGLGQRHRPRPRAPSRPRSSSSSTPRPWRSRPTDATSSAPTPRPTTSASSTRRPTRSSRRSGPRRARPTCLGPRPTPWPSPKTARRSTSPTAPRTRSPPSTSIRPSGSPS